MEWNILLYKFQKSFDFLFDFMRQWRYLSFLEVC